MSGFDLPILGEPLVPEFANTLYIQGPVRNDVFDRADSASAWMTTAPAALEIGAPRTVPSTSLGELRELRDAVRCIVGCGPSTGLADAVRSVNRAVGLAPPRSELAVRDGGVVAVIDGSGAKRVERFMAAVASAVVQLVDDGELASIRTCRRTGCTMLFRAQHHRRAYCNARCASADRQARYNQRLRGDRS